MYIVLIYVLIGQVHFILQNGCNDLQETGGTTLVVVLMRKRRGPEGCRCL